MTMRALHRRHYGPRTQNLGHSDALSDGRGRPLVLALTPGQAADIKMLPIMLDAAPLKHGPRPRSATTSVVTGPAASPSQKDAG